MSTEISSRESKERCFNLTKGNLHLDISQGSSSLGKNQYVFHLSRTDVAGAEDDGSTTTKNSTGGKSGGGLSILTSSSVNVITTKVSFCAKSETTRGAWIDALKKNLSNLKTGS